MTIASVTAGAIYVGAEMLLLFIAALAFVRVGFMRLDSSLGIARDGIAPGKLAPRFALPDVSGVLHSVPADRCWQLLLFGGDALIAFPELVAALNRTFDFTILVMTQSDRERSLALQQGLGLKVPVIPADQKLYDSFRVRVAPFGYFLDPDGHVRWLGLLNTSDHLLYAWHMAQLHSQERARQRGGSR